MQVGLGGFVVIVVVIVVVVVVVVVIGVGAGFGRVRAVGWAQEEGGQEGNEEASPDVNAFRRQPEPLW